MVLFVLDGLFWTSLSLLLPDNFTWAVQEWIRHQFLDVITELPFSRKLEREADYMGLILGKANALLYFLWFSHLKDAKSTVSRAGFNIEAATDLWEGMSGTEGSIYQSILVPIQVMITEWRISKG